MHILMICNNDEKVRDYALFLSPLIGPTTIELRKSYIGAVQYLKSCFEYNQKIDLVLMDEDFAWSEWDTSRNVKNMYYKLLDFMKMFLDGDIPIIITRDYNMQTALEVKQTIKEFIMGVRDHE